MKNLKIFLLTHQNQKKYYFDEKKYFFDENISLINLDELEIGRFQTNKLAESRIFFSDLIDGCDCDYVGILSYSYNEKFPRLIPVERIRFLTMGKNIVLAPYVASEKWVQKSEIAHRGMLKYLIELSQFTNMELDKKNGVFCNSFICHKDEFLKFKYFFLDCFDYFFKKYNFEMMFSGGYVDRHPNYFYERFATMYFSNSKNLIIKNIPYKKMYI